MEDKIYKLIKNDMDKSMNTLKKVNLFLYSLIVLFALYCIRYKIYVAFLAMMVWVLFIKVIFKQAFELKKEYDDKLYQVKKEIVLKKYEQISYNNSRGDHIYYYIITKRDNCIYVRTYKKDIYEKVDIDEEIYVVILDKYIENDKDIPITEEMMDKADIVHPLQFKNINNKIVQPIEISYAFIEQDLFNN